MLNNLPSKYEQFCKKKKKTLIYLISGILVITGIGTFAYFAWPKKETKTEIKIHNKEEIKQLKTELSSLKSKLNNLSDNTQKTQLESNLSNIENQIKNLSENPNKSTLKNLEQQIKKIKKTIEGIIEVKKPSPEPIPNPQPDNNFKNRVINYVATKINDNTYKYTFNTQIQGDDKSKEELTFKYAIDFLEWKYNMFFNTFQRALKDANAKFPAYFWKCPPVSQKTLDKPFEFVVIKSEGLNSITQDFNDFRNQIVKLKISGQGPQVISFPNLGGDAILVIPSPYENGQAVYHNKNISDFTKNAPLEKQQELWQEVAKKLSEELAKGDTPRWLNTHGLGVKYLHVRIDEKAKYYGDYIEYK